MARSAILPRLAGGGAVAFGALTVVSGTSALLGSVDMGAVVPFVLWFNTLAGVAYVVAGVGLWRRRRWSFALSLAVCGATLAVFAAFGLHVAMGGAFEMRTVFAMTLRSTVWAGIAFVARRATRDRWTLSRKG